MVLEVLFLTLCVVWKLVEQDRVERRVWHCWRVPGTRALSRAGRWPWSPMSLEGLGGG